MLQSASRTLRGRFRRVGTRRLACAAFIVALLNWTAAGPGGRHAVLAQEPPRGQPAPELEGGVAWLNTARPIRLADLRGKIVVLDFWTFCCINCIHTLPDLARLEKKYADQVVVIGVHSAKFDSEKDSSNIRKAILRYEINHPVVNDALLKIWTAYGLSSWPTLCLIDPEGRYLGQVPGEGNVERLERAIERLIVIHRRKQTLDERPRQLAVTDAPDRRAQALYFPGKVLADETGRWLFIADSTHHRIVITDLQGKKIAICGSGRPGFADGPFEQAQFCDPQGMARRGQTLYVADRKNHAIRALDLDRHTVQTVAGTGTQDRLSRAGGGPGRQLGLNSPWALCLHGERLYIAMAGHHQIWTLDLGTGVAAPLAGNGLEALTDGAPAQASFAQPSGLCTDGTWLYVADSEASAIRRVPLSGQGEVQTIVGRGLFDFGDRDGAADEARLQHPLGLAFFEGKLYVADTYNNKLKVIDPDGRTCRTLLGDRGGWLADPLFNHPGGVSPAGGNLCVADTNAHRIRVVNPHTRTVSTLAMRDVGPPD